MAKGAQTTTATLPQFQQDMYNELFERSKAESEKEFTPYTGQMVADLTPGQVAASDFANTMAGQAFGTDAFAGLQQIATGATPQLQDVQFDAAQLGELDIEKYLSPETDLLIDRVSQDFDRQRLLEEARAQDKAIRSGAFGGSRSAIFESEATRGIDDAEARELSRLRENAYQSALDRALAEATGNVDRQQQANLERARLEGQFSLARPDFDLRNRALQSGIFGDLASRQTGAVDLLSRLGSSEQLLEQARLDALRNEFDREQQFGIDRLNILGSGVTAMPSLVGQRQDKKVGVGDILGAGAQLGSAYLMSKSDPRLKENIKYIGKSIDGHNLYTWTWNNIAKLLGITGQTFGVMADEILMTNPDLVHLDTDGYLMVNYAGIK